MRLYTTRNFDIQRRCSATAPWRWFSSPKLLKACGLDPDFFNHRVARSHTEFFIVNANAPLFVETLHCNVSEGEPSKRKENHFENKLHFLLKMQFRSMRLYRTRNCDIQRRCSATSLRAVYPFHRK